MIVNPEIIKDLCDSAGKLIEEKARKYVEEKKINIKKVIYDNENTFEIRSKVKQDSDIYDVYIHALNGEIENVMCNCVDYYNNYGACEHILATLLEFNQNESYVRIFSGKLEENHNDITMYKKHQKQEEKYRNFKQLIHAFYPTHELESSEGKQKILLNSIKLEPKLIYNSYLKTLKLEVKIGDKQLYKLKNFPEFYDRMQKKEFYRYGTKLEFVHEQEVFSEESIPLLNYILKYSEIIKYANESTNSYTYYSRTMEDSYITISNSGLDELFEVLAGKQVTIQKEGVEKEILFLKAMPDIKFEIREEGKNEYTLVPNIDIYNYDILEGRNSIYILIDNTLYQCDESFKQTTLKLLQVYRNNFTNNITFPKSELSKLFSIVFPKVRDKIETNNLNSKEIEKYIPKELYVKLYLDYNEKNYINADIKFVYGNKEFNPLLEQDLNIPRDIAKEDEILETFRKSGFMLDVENKRLILVNEENIYQFLVSDIENYMKKFEVLATDNFKQKEIKKPKIEMLGVKIENNLLNIDFSNLDFDPSELKEIMQKYKLKKRYHRLKNGSFLDLEKNETIDFIDSLTNGMDISYKELEKGQLKLPIFRSLYLDRILKNIKNSNITKNEEYKNLVNKIENKDFSDTIILPKNLNATLRNYQKTGYEWLKVLDSYKFGGILADDMGLRKDNTIISCCIRLYPKRRKTKTNYCSMSKFT